MDCARERGNDAKNTPPGATWSQKRSLLNEKVPAIQGRTNVIDAPRERMRQKDILKKPLTPGKNLDDPRAELGGYRKNSSKTTDGSRQAMERPQIGPESK